MHSFCINVISLDHFRISFKIEKCSEGENELLTVFIEEKMYTQYSGGPTEVRTSSFAHISLSCQLGQYSSILSCCLSAFNLHFMNDDLSIEMRLKCALHHSGTFFVLFHLFAAVAAVIHVLYTQFWCARNIQQHFHDNKNRSFPFFYFIRLIYFSKMKRENNKRNEEEQKSGTKA